LVDRWLKKVSEEAEKMNEVNTLYDKLIEANKQLELQKKCDEDIRQQQALAISMNDSILSRLDIKNENFSIILPTKAVRLIEAHKGECHTISYNLNGSILASGGDDNTVKLWESRACSLKSTLMGSFQSVMDVAFSPNDEFVLGASNDNSVRLWSVQYGRMRHTLTGHTGKVLSATFSSDSQKVISGSHDRSIRIYDLVKGYCIRTIICFSSCNSLTTTVDDNLICSGHLDSQLRFWDSKTGECGRELTGLHTAQITSVSISPDGRSVLTNSRDNTLKLVDIRTFDVLHTFSNEEYRSGTNWNSSCFSPNGSYISAGGADGKVFIWEILNGKLVKLLKPSSSQNNVIEAVAWSPSGSQLSSCDKSGTITVWT